MCASLAYASGQHGAVTNSKGKLRSCDPGISEQAQSQQACDMAEDEWPCSTPVGLPFSYQRVGGAIVPHGADLSGKKTPVCWMSNRCANRGVVTRNLLGQHRVVRRTPPKVS